LENHRGIGHRVRFRALLLCTSQLASATGGNNNRSDRRGKIGEKIVDLSRRQPDQDLSNRVRSEPSGREARRRRHETPEGIYKIDGRNAQSSFHLALHISYPSDEDNRSATTRGVSAGFDIMIHGIQNGRGWIGAFHHWKDWTAGCIALTDEEIEELWRVTPDGTTIEIRP
jgi:L,D-transpeptidase catalytic domain